MTDAPDPSATTYDLIVIGGGSTGENVADRAVRGGLSVALVEDELYGGECSYWACMPSKALLRPVELAAAVARVPGLAGSEIDARKVLDRRDEFTSHWDDSGQQEWVEGAGIAPVRGRGRLSGERTVTVTAGDGSTRELTATYAVVLATGTQAKVPDVPGLKDVSPWTSREVTSMKDVPASLIVIGGGVVACEMAQAVQGLGGQVTMLVRGDALLEKLEPWAGELVAEGLRETGVQIRFSTSASSFRRDASGVTAVLDDGELTAEQVLVATGRAPRTDLGLDVVGLEAGSYVEVDDSMRTSIDWLYAAGDVNGRALLTHMGKYQARVCGDVIAARAQGRPDDGPSLRATGPVPQVTFTDPQASSVGLTLAAARDAGRDVREVTVGLGSVAGAALLADGYRGKAGLVLEGDGADAVVVGATFVGQEVAELLHSATIAVTAAVPLSVLWHAVPSYPTVSEAWLRLLTEAGL